jgi:signal transduction histidine kinase/ActR/RegA family two-component response regulator
MLTEWLQGWLFPPSRVLTRRVERWLPPESQGSFDRDARRKRIFVRGALGIFEVLLPVDLILAVRGMWERVLFATSILVVTAGALHLSRARRFDSAANGLLCTLLLVVAISAWCAEDRLLAVWIWAPTIPLNALSVGGARMGTRWLLITSLTFVAVWAARSLGVEPPLRVGDELDGAAVLVTGVGVLFSIVGLVGAYENDMVRSIEEAEARTRELETAQADLEARNRSLVEAQGRLEALNRDLVASRDAAEAGVRARSEFLATISHEVRTPMNAVIGMTTLLLDTPLSVEQRTFTDTIRASGESLLTLLNDVLDYSKIDAGHLELESVTFEPSAEARRVVELMRGAASARNNHIELTVGEKVPRCVRGDPGRLRQVLLNLASNAVKFTSGGLVSVRLSASVEDGRTWLRCDVVDTGIGIAPDALARIFRPFTQADASTTRRFGGTGLGLAISSRLAALLGGSLDVTSRPGEGSTFTLRVPVVPTRPATLAPVRHSLGPVSDADACSLRVLVAEDNPVNQRVITLMLSRMGHRVDVVGDGVEAVEAFVRAAYDLALMDVQMPEMDGLAATRRIRTLEDPARRMPIVALTANAFADDRARCLDAGMDDFLAKPVRREELSALLKRACRQRLSA